MSIIKKKTDETIIKLIKYDDNLNDDLMQFFYTTLERIDNLITLKKKISKDYLHIKMFYTSQKELYNKEIRHLESKIINLNRELREFDKSFIQLKQNLGRLQITSEEALILNINRFEQITYTRMLNCRRHSYIFAIETYYDYIHQYNQKYEDIITEYKDSVSTLSIDIQNFYEDRLNIEDSCKKMFEDEYIVKQQCDILLSKIPSETRIENIDDLPKFELYHVRQVVPKVYNDSDFTEQLIHVQIPEQEEQREEQYENNDNNKRELQSQTMVQCDSCKKWRICPDELLDELTRSKFKCNKNTWDIHYASCDIPDDNIDYSNTNETYYSPASSSRGRRTRRRVVVDSDDDL
jgi:hypothetical protein